MKKEKLQLTLELFAFIEVPSELTPMHPILSVLLLCFNSKGFSDLLKQLKVVKSKAIVEMLYPLLYPYLYFPK